MSQKAIPFLMMRAGSSRGPFFNRSHLPDDPEKLAKVLSRILGSGHKYNIDGIGGGVAVTTKVAMLSLSDSPDADIDYFFAQVPVENGKVDFRPTCGNILSGVGPAAIEMGLLPLGSEGERRIRIRAVNTGALVEAIIKTDHSGVVYQGDMRLDGVPGTAAPIRLNFRNITGSLTGAMLPTGNAKDCIDGISVTCIDVAMPMVIARAEAFGLTGTETPDELNSNLEFCKRREAIRVEAGHMMGLGDVSEQVTPKFGLLAPAKNGGTATVRHFMPFTCHPGMAVTGAQCLAACLALPGSIGEGLAQLPQNGLVDLILEHPSGQIVIGLDYKTDAQKKLEIESASVFRTARLLVRGEVMVPDDLFEDELD